MYCISMLLISLSLLHITSSDSLPSICSKGCELLYNLELNCGSHQAFVPTEYIINIDKIIDNNLYICYIPSNSIISEPESFDTVPQDNTSTNPKAAMFDLDSYVLIWQAIVIAIIVPLIALLLFKLILIIFNKAFETLHCKENNHKYCSICLYCCSADYRQQKRNHKFQNLNDENINENNNQNQNYQLFKWKFGRKKNNNIPVENNNNNNNNKIGEDDIDIVLNKNANDYVNVPLNELEEVSVEHNDKYLQAPGGNNQDIELSFSSQGLRQISYRDVV